MITVTMQAKVRTLALVAIALMLALAPSGCTATPIHPSGDDLGVGARPDRGGIPQVDTGASPDAIIGFPDHGSSGDTTPPSGDLGGDAFVGDGSPSDASTDVLGDGPKGDGSAPSG
jgi:hypothetical protein